jgi:uncharacterized phage protein (TIGR02220 family)
MEHSFDIYIAKLYGIPSAVLLKNIYFWIEKNRANEKNYYDGYYWTYNSKKAFAELFPYMTARQIDYALQKLIDDGLIVTGNYNKVAYDRTLWYAITKKGYSILQKCEMDVTDLGNGDTESVSPIPNNKPYSKTTNNNTDKYIVIIDRLNEKSGMNYRSSSKATQGHINARLADGFTVEDFFSVIDKKCAEWRGTDMEKYLRPETLFGSKFENYLNAPVTQRRQYGTNGIAVDHNAPDDLAGIF